MTCDSLYFKVDEFMMKWDTNADGYINGLEDDNNVDEFNNLAAKCDLNHDGNVCKSEVMYCIVRDENANRANACPGYGDLCCEDIYDEWCECRYDG